MTLGRLGFKGKVIGQVKVSKVNLIIRKGRGQDYEKYNLLQKKGTLMSSNSPGDPGSLTLTPGHVKFSPHSTPGTHSTCRCFNSSE